MRRAPIRDINVFSSSKPRYHDIFNVNSSRISLEASFTKFRLNLPPSDDVFIKPLLELVGLFQLKFFLQYVFRYLILMLNEDMRIKLLVASTSSQKYN